MRPATSSKSTSHRFAGNKKGGVDRHHHRYRTASTKGKDFFRPSIRLLDSLGTSLEDSLGKGSVLRDVLDGVAVLLEPALLAALHVLL